MKLDRFFYAAGLLAVANATSPASYAGKDAKRVAIIGAGAAGASTAYHLRQFANEDGVAVNITIFEKMDRIGGRTLTVDAFGDETQPVELGASIFVKVNQIMWNATQAFGLSLESPGGEVEGVLGIWDGDKFVYTQDESSSDWWSLARLFWKYGLAPYRANKLMQATVSRFLMLYTAPYFPFRSLSIRAFELELAEVTSQTGEQFLAQNNIAVPFVHDIIQASTRVNYASNLAKIHGLDTMVALAPQGASQIEGGNWQLFARFVADSQAEFHGNTSVTSITRASDAPSSPQYVLKTKSMAGTEKENTFDSVVIATPYQFSNIEAGKGVLQETIDAIPYVRLHVTLFTSPLPLSAAFFGLAPGTPTPTTVLTTLAADDDASSGVEGAGKAGFFSISTLRRVTNPRTGREEYLYKIFSPAKVTADFLTKLFGVDVPATFTRDARAETDKADTEYPDGTDDAADILDPISWYYPHVFHSYPKAYPRVTFQDPVVGDALYYTSGIESFISTMETSALSGKNAARLIVDDFQGRPTGEAAPGGTNAAPPAGEL